MLKSSIYEERGEISPALQEIETVLDLYGKSGGPMASVRPYYAYLLAKDGNIPKAEEVAQALKTDIEEHEPTGMYHYWGALGGIEMGKGDAKAAVTYLEKSREEEPEDQGPSFLLSEAYLESGALDKAVASLEKALSSYDNNRAGDPIDAVKLYYLLGLAYERSGWNEKAIEKYEEFLDIWKNADPGLPEVTDAKARLAKLKNIG
jgi:predicted Zn-dependent protease